MADLLFRSGRLIDPVSGFDGTADVLIAGSAIAGVGSGIDPGGAEVVDISGAVICPGFVDMHTHLRQPGREDEETVASGSAAAAAGGYTAICAMPNTDPVCDNASVAEMVVSEGARAGLVEVIAAGAITKGLAGKSISPIGEMARCAAGVRLFTDDGMGVADARLLRRAMEYIKAFGGICAEHCEEASLSRGGQMNEGEFSDSLGLKGIPAEAEEVALARDLALARLTGVRFHAMHISTAGSVELIRKAKAQGLNVTAEATAHHLSLTEAELVAFDAAFKVNPPLRSAADVEAVRAGLADGTIDAVATDHAPHSAEEKEGEFELAPPGMLGLETALSVVLTELVEPGVVDLSGAIRAMSCNPAAILGLSGQGGPVVAGAEANLVVFDSKATRQVDPAAFESLSTNSPWAGRTLKGRVLHTVFRGVRTVADGAVVAAAVA